MTRSDVVDMLLIGLVSYVIGILILMLLKDFVPSYVNTLLVIVASVLCLGGTINTYGCGMALLQGGVNHANP